MYQRWKRWFDQIGRDITELVVHRHVYREVYEIINANPGLQVASSFYDWMRLAYVNQMAVGVRRLTDPDRRSISLVRLMDEIEQDPEVISRRRFVGLYSPHLRRKGHRDFDRIAGPGAPHVNPAIIRRQRRGLLRAEWRLRLFVNRHVAHRSRHPLRRLPSYAELNACVDLLEQLMKDYTLMLKADGLARVLPTWQYDWKQIFRISWIS